MDDERIKSGGSIPTEQHVAWDSAAQPNRTIPR